MDVVMEHIKEMEMHIDSKKKTVWIYTYGLDTWIDSMVHGKSIFTQEPIDGLLFQFIKADFHNWKGFLDFVTKWGLSGLRDLYSSSGQSQESLPALEHTDGSALFHHYYACTYKALLDAQRHFKLAIDFSINAGNEPFLEEFNPWERYFLGEATESIAPLHMYARNYTIRIKPEPVVAEHIENSVNFPIDVLAEYMKSKDAPVRMVYTTGDIRSLLYFQFLELINDFNIRKCANCSDYFIPIKKSNEKYCSRCSDIGYANKVKNDPLLKAYQTAYNTKHAQQKRMKEDKSLEEVEIVETAFNRWRDTARWNLSQAQDGKLSEEEFMAFLKAKLEV